MRKVISSIILFIVFLIQFSIYVQAADPCSIKFSTSNTSLNKGDTLTLGINMSNITLENGITGFYSVLDYSKDVFQIVVDESEDAKDVIKELKGTEYENCKVLYIGENDEDSSVLNPWTILLLEDNGDVGIIGLCSEAQIKSQKIGEIKFQIKENAKNGDSKITLKELSVIDFEDKEKSISNVFTTVKINDGITNPVEAPKNTANKVSNYNQTSNEVKNNTQKINNANNINTKNQSSEAKQDVPKAGAPIIFPIIILAVVAIIVKYKKYNNYKDI